jgi:hypothetical protein
VWKAAEKRILNSKEENGTAEKLSALGPEPKPPPDPTFLFENPTWHGLVKRLRTNVLDVGIFADDAGKVVGGYSMSEEQRTATAANMNSAWDGRPMQRVLASEESFIITGARLAMHLMVQPQIIANWYGDRALADQGFLARFLTCAKLSSSAIAPKARAESAMKALCRVVRFAPLPIRSHGPGALRPVQVATMVL